MSIKLRLCGNYCFCLNKTGNYYIIAVNYRNKQQYTQGYKIYGELTGGAVMGELKVKYSNPKGLYDSKFYSQIVTVSGRGKTIYVGGQNAVNAEGEVVGEGSLELQTKQALRKIKIALESENATFDNVIKLNIYLVDGCDPAEGVRAFRETVGDLKNPPLITVVKVAGLANPSYLVEIDAIAVVEEKGD